MTYSHNFSLKTVLFSMKFMILMSFGHSTQAKLLLVLEGIPAAGKSTLCKAIADHIPGVHIIPEPFNRWNNVGESGNLFQEYIKDKNRWGLTFQQYVCLTFSQALHDAYIQHPEKEIFITDRSYFSTLFVFGRMLFENSTITSLEWELLQEHCIWFIENALYQPDGFIFLHTQPATARERALKRNRALKASLHIAYFEHLHALHTQWLVEKKHTHQSLEHVPVLTLDGEVDFVHDTSACQNIIEQVKNFIDQIAL
jgi:deoxyadenosine/deoxycytidine kinase